MNRRQFLAKWSCLVGPWLCRGTVRLQAAEEVKKEKGVIVIEPECFRTIMAKKPPLGEKISLGDRLLGYRKDEKTVVVEHEKMKVPPDAEQRFALYAQIPYHWYAKDPQLVKDVTKEMTKQGERKEPALTVGKARLDKGLSFTGRKGKVTLEFDYRRSKEEPPPWIYKVDIEG